MEELSQLIATRISYSIGGTQLLSPLELTLRAGEITVLLGPNGAGKSTLLHILAGCSTPSTGGISVNGVTDISKQRHIGYLPDSPPLYSELRIIEQLEFSGEIHGMKRSTIKERMALVLEQCDITDRQHQLIKQLSKGYRQRVGLAQAMLHSPAFLLLDEPTEGLDPAQIIHLRQLLISLAKKGTSVLLSTHLLDEALHIADRILFMNQGVLSEAGDLATLKKEYPNPEDLYKHLSEQAS